MCMSVQTWPADQTESSWDQEHASPLVARLRRGDKDAVGFVYDRYSAIVRAFATRLIGDEDAAEDLVHDVFVSLPKLMRNFRGSSSLRVFVLGVAANKARHFVRAASRRRAAMDRLELHQTHCSSPTEDDNPEAKARQEELRRLLCRALDALSFEHRTVFVLCVVEERSSFEAAEILGIPAATVRSRLFHGRRKLQSILAREEIR